jgi:hypothetical protein
MSTHRKARRGLRALVLGAVCALALTAITATPAPALTAPADNALDWLGGELSDNGFGMPASFDPSVTDWGLTADAVLALAAGGKGTSSTAAATTDNVLANVGSYATGADFGSPNDRYAGALGKALLLALVQDRGTTHDGLNLEVELRARMVASGAQAGRLSDQSDFGDFSNGLGQALGVMALERTASGVPAAAVSFLISQQCPAGGFRLDYSSGDACTSNASIDTDATSFAVQALLAAPASTAVSTAATNGVTWLLDKQAGNGSFAGSGPTAVANANSTGLAAAALRAAGRFAAANEAATFVESLRLTAGPDAGAIAYDKATHDAAQGNAIDDAQRDQFRRASAQGVFAIGLPSYAQIGSVPPVDPHPTATVTAGSIEPGATIEVTGRGFLPREDVHGTLHSDPVDLGTETADDDGVVVFAVTLPADLEPGTHNVELVGATSGVVVTADLTVVSETGGTTPTSVSGGSTITTTELPRTGNGETGSIGLAVVAAGCALVLATRRGQTAR